MFLSEKDLKEKFWENYNYSGRAIRHQFECNIREGAADLITVEVYQENYQINAFEFKLSDIKKAILQAEANKKYVNKSWIVIPQEKEQLINNKYLAYIKERGIGVITVESGGRWKMCQKPIFNQKLVLNQALINLMMKGY